MFNINFTQLIAELTPTMLRNKPVLAAWLSVLISPVKSLHASFLQFRSDVIYKARFTGQIIYLEKRLNDRFDNIPRRIYIENVADLNWVYLFNQSELQQPLYLYNVYNPATAYSVGQYAQTEAGVYRCLTTSTGNDPDTSPGSWQLVSDPLYLQNMAEYALTYDFIVRVPASLVFDINEMRAIVNYYKLAGKRYTIQTY